MKTSIANISLCIALAVIGLVSCKSDDPDVGSIVSNKEMISPDIPAKTGWSGSTRDGIAKYVPAGDEDDYDEPDGYYSFEMKDGICESAVYNLVMESAMEAKTLASMLNSGKWVDTDHDFDPDFASTRSGLMPKVYDMAKRAMVPATMTVSTRSPLVLPIPVRQEGRVIYMVIPNVKGLSMSELRTIVEYWSGQSEKMPDHVIFGTYENGIYTCENMGGMNMKYVVTTAFNDRGLCTKYVTAITLPNEGWAQLYYATYDAQLDDFEEQFGKRPELTLEGTTVMLDAVIIGDVTKAEVDAMIYSLDWLNNCPILYSFFG